MIAAIARPFRAIRKLALDFALPLRCAGCGDVVDEVDAFCTMCWNKMEWLGNSGCLGASAAPSGGGTNCADLLGQGGSPCPAHALGT